MVDIKTGEAEQGRSTEAEISAIQDPVARPDGRVRLGSALVELFRPLGGVTLHTERDPKPPPIVKFD